MQSGTTRSLSNVQPGWHRRRRRFLLLFGRLLLGRQHTACSAWLFIAVVETVRNSQRHRSGNLCGFRSWRQRRPKGAQLFAQHHRQFADRRRQLTEVRLPCVQLTLTG